MQIYKWVGFPCFLSAITLSAVRHYTICCPPLHIYCPSIYVSDYPFSILKLLFNIFQYLIGNHLDCLHAYSRRFCWKRVEMQVQNTMNYILVCIGRYKRMHTSGAGTVYPSGELEFTPNSQWGSCCSIFSFRCSVLQIVVYPIVLFLSAILLYVLLRVLIIPLVSSTFSLKDNT